MKSKKVWLVGIILIVLALTLVILRFWPQLANEVAIQGVITQIQPADDGIVALIETPSGDQVLQYDKASVRIHYRTPIFLERERIDVQQLETGMYVAVAFEGAVAESYPVQGSAQTVEIIQLDQLK